MGAPRVSCSVREGVVRVLWGESIEVVIVVVVGGVDPLGDTFIRGWSGGVTGGTRDVIHEAGVLTGTRGLARWQGLGRGWDCRDSAAGRSHWSGRG